MLRLAVFLWVTKLKVGGESFSSLLNTLLDSTIFALRFFLFGKTMK